MERRPYAEDERNLVCLRYLEVKKMRKDIPLKVAVCFASFALYLAVPVKAARTDDSTVPTEQGVAGIAYSLENYYGAVQKKEKTVKVAPDAKLVHILNTKVLSPYVNLGVSVADDYVNVRSKPSTDSEVTGKLYRGCAANILDRLEGDWVKIESGDVKGYIASSFLVTGDDAESMVDKYATKKAEVDTETLNVRERPNTDAKILTQIPQGERYIILKENDEWAKILLGNDDDNGDDFTGFVSKEHIKIHVKFKKAISIEEENRLRKAEEARQRAEQEQRENLQRDNARRVQEQAERAESDRRSSSGSSSSQASSSGSGSSSNLVSYALKFVGNPYVWGGESLTSGADCSGFVRSVYGDFGYSLPRTSREQAAGAGRRVDISDRRPGDLIFYTNSSGTVNHVAMYIGNNRIVQAANSREGIITSQYNYRDVYCVRRVMN
jgi:cell wall-associated NlpC family hydrolase